MYVINFQLNSNSSEQAIITMIHREFPHLTLKELEAMVRKRKITTITEASADRIYISICKCCIAISMQEVNSEDDVYAASKRVNAAASKIDKSFERWSTALNKLAGILEKIAN